MNMFGAASALRRASTSTSPHPPLVRLNHTLHRLIRDKHTIAGLHAALDLAWHNIMNCIF